ncbi:hypothetical protein ACHQM5_030517 [Ranunculus cassubicifolius]
MKGTTGEKPLSVFTVRTAAQLVCVYTEYLLTGSLYRPFSWVCKKRVRNGPKVPVVLRMVAFSMEWSSENVHDTRYMLKATCHLHLSQIALWSRRALRIMSPEGT